MFRFKVNGFQFNEAQLVNTKITDKSSKNDYD